MPWNYLNSQKMTDMRLRTLEKKTRFLVEENMHVEVVNLEERDPGAW